MLEQLAPGHEFKPGTHRYSVHYNGKHAFLDKGKGGTTSKKDARSSVEVRIQKVAAMAATLELCFECVREWFPDVKLPGDKIDVEKDSYCSDHKDAS